MPNVEFQQQCTRLLEQDDTASVVFDLLAQDIFSKPALEMVVIQFFAQRKAAKLSRDNEGNLIFLHVDPVHGTRGCKVCLWDFKESEVLRICIGWSPEKLILYVLDMDKKLPPKEGEDFIR